MFGMRQVGLVAVASVVALAGACTSRSGVSPPSVPAPSSSSVVASPAARTSQQRSAPTITSASTIDFVDPVHGFLGGIDGVWSTDDGGLTWRRIWNGPGSIMAIDALDDQHLWASVDHHKNQAPRLLATRDGGLTWRQLDVGPVILQLTMTSTTTGWGIRGVAGSPSSNAFPYNPQPVVRTTDGGRTWRPTGVIAQSLCAVDPDVAWIALRSIIQRTLDGGATWYTTRLYPRGSFSSAQIACSGVSSAWDLAVGDGAMSQQPYIASKTTDGGASWTPVLHEAYFPPPPGVSGFRDEIDAYAGPLAMPSTSAVFFAGSSPAAQEMSITRSDDGGLTFDHSKLGAPGNPLLAYPLAFSFSDLFHGWLLVGDRQSKAHIWRTTDRGVTWHRIPLVSDRQDGA
jgi:photosystem II stability/assembly factor-like uncharacterized protein